MTNGKAILDVTPSAETTAGIRDRDLLQRHMQGDPSAFEALVKRYRRELFNFLARFCGDAAMAEDVFQEAFLQLHTSAEKFDMSRRLKPWLFTIAANKARDAMRSRSRKYAAPLDAPVGDEGDRTTYASFLPADIPLPEETLSNQETRQAVEKIVSEMPENLRTVLLLNYFQGFAYKDIAEILDVPLGTVKSRLHAAVREFANRWKATTGTASHE